MLSNEINKNRIRAVVLGGSWCITFLAFIYIKVNTDKQTEQKEKFLRARIELNECQEKKETSVEQVKNQEIQLRRSMEQLQKALEETRQAKEYALEQAKVVAGKK
jgi:uncharacterized protein YlxW (UPF0749 family)